MNKGLLLGLVIGAVTGWFITKKYYEAEYEVIDEGCEYDLDESAEEEVRVIKNKIKKFEDRQVDKNIERKGPRVNVVENVKDLAPIEEEDFEGELVEKRTDIILITEDDYDEEYQHFDKIELQYQMEEDCLYDSNGKDELPLSTVTTDFIAQFRENKDVFMYVRDHKLEIDYLVEKCSIHVDIPEYHSLTSAYNEEKDNILKEKNGG